MAEYIDRDALIKHYRELLCKDCERRKGTKNGKLKFCYKIGEAPCRACSVDDMIGWIEDFPADDVQCGNKWTPTSERLPEDKTSFIVTITTKFLTRVTTATRIGDEYFEGGERLYFGAIKAWMPLPKPYKEGE